MKYPNIEVQLTGRNGNAFAIIGTVSKALRQANVNKDEIEKFIDEAMSADYDNLLVTCMNWVDVN